MLPCVIDSKLNLYKSVFNLAMRDHIAMHAIGVFSQHVTEGALPTPADEVSFTSKLSSFSNFLHFLVEAIKNGISERDTVLRTAYTAANGYKPSNAKTKQKRATGRFRTALMIAFFNN